MGIEGCDLRRTIESTFGYAAGCYHHCVGNCKDKDFQKIKNKAIFVSKPINPSQIVCYEPQTCFSIDLINNCLLHKCFQPVYAAKKKKQKKNQQNQKKKKQTKNKSDK